MDVKVSLPDSFQNELSEQIKKAAYEAFNEIKSQSAYPDFMTIKQTAQFLGVSRGSLEQKFIPAGLPIVDVDGLMRISKKSAIEFMDKHNR